MVPDHDPRLSQITVPDSSPQPATQSLSFEPIVCRFSKLRGEEAVLDQGQDTSGGNGFNDETDTTSSRARQEPGSHWDRKQNKTVPKTTRSPSK
ncbi:hypothetical protein G6O67_003374 [Ophiocordyceps sinensis]|uniref:Uncharacterized protein n=2 Tax=Ophiocordyceps sinensis TaxID=72228 RepID=A0A8H4V881_9HYPO|nr:hypothetical protein OCS_02877 [Ophiocordyceps sinensis CO18]KAF4511592.1 hypothetical protein G6O67_003374 [Ophiocordyceps sinensis]